MQFDITCEKTYKLLIYIKDLMMNKRTGLTHISLIMSTKMLIEVNKEAPEKEHKDSKDDCLELIQLKGGNKCQILKC